MTKRIRVTFPMIFFQILLGAVLVAGLSISNAAALGSKLINVNPDHRGEKWLAGGISREQWAEAVKDMRPLVIKRTGLQKTVVAPARVDNSRSPAFRPVFSQVGGSCAQASAIGYVFTYEMNTLRGVAGDVPDNQFPYDFTYNFLNGGSGNSGSWMTSGWDIATALGIPTVTAYGGFGQGKFTRWPTGYAVYCNAMTNRSNGWFSIDVSTPAGINTVREWLSSRGTGATHGGCLVFAYNASGAKIVTLANRTPDAGMLAMVQGGTTAGHAVTIAGYDDSVRYDFNGDGKYTNTVDINGDGKVDLRDWEIGALIIVNSWGAGFGDFGKIYVPYRFCAKDMWGAAVYGMYAGTATVTPKLAIKTTLYHSNKSMIRIQAGYAPGSDATAASVSKGFAGAFNYCGGSIALGSSASPMELGFDISEYAGRPDAAYFLLIDSKGGSGMMKSFSLLDYSFGGAPLEALCPSQNVALGKGGYKFKIALPKLLVQTPNNGEKWVVGTANTITWVTRNFTENVRIDLYKAGKLLATIGPSAPNTGSYSWTVPAKQTVAADYTIRISGTKTATVADVSDKPFSIVKTLAKEELIAQSPARPEYEPAPPVARLRIGDRTRAEFEMPLPAPALLDIFVCDMLGRQVWRSTVQFSPVREVAADGPRISRGFYIVKVIARDNDCRLMGAWSRRVNVLR